MSCEEVLRCEVRCCCAMLWPLTFLDTPTCVAPPVLVSCCRYDLFDELGDAHDRAVSWLKTRGILRLAGDVITFCLHQGFGKQPPRPHTHTETQTQTQTQTQTLSLKEGDQKQQEDEEEGGEGGGRRVVLTAPVDPYRELMEASSITNYARVKHQEALKNEKLAATEGIAQKQVRNKDEDEDFYQRMGLYGLARACLRVVVYV